jgi:type II restriction enzyme
MIKKSAENRSGPINEIRRLELKKLFSSCTAEIIFVTAFISRKEYVKWASQIAWETEVWLADNPDHMIHFNGNKFMGPYQSKD